MSKKELAEALGYIFPNKRVDYEKLFKKVQESGLLLKLDMTPSVFRAMHKERFSRGQSKIIQEHFKLERGGETTPSV